MNRLHLPLTPLACACAFSLLPLGSHAQDASKPGTPPAPTDTQQVIVSGEKTRRPLDKTLTSVTVNTARDLQDHADVTLTDVLARTPGVQTAPHNETFSIRGAPVAGLGEQGPNDLISVYVDGAVQPRQTVTLGTLSVWDLEQVEVLRGPQSTVQGRNAMAGAIVLQSKNPTHEPTAGGQLRGGSHGERGAAAVVGGSVLPKTLAARLAVDYVEDDGYIRNTVLGKDANARRSLTARGKLLWQPADAVDALLTLAHTDHRRGNPVVTQHEDGRIEFYRVSTNADAWDNMLQNTLSAQLEWRLAPAWTLHSTTAATRTRYGAVLDFDQTDTPPVDEVLRDHRHRLASQELRVAYAGTSLQAHVGLYAGRADEDRTDRLQFDGETALGVFGDTRVRNRALFGEATWRFAPRWQLIGGLRHERERNRSASHFDDEAQTVTNARYTASLPKLGLSFEPGEDHLFGVVLQKGYRGGGSAFNIAEEKAVPFDPEYSLNQELSYRGRWLDRRLQVHLNVYQTRWKDQQVSYLTEAGNDNSAQVANAGRSRQRGMELSLQHDWSRALRLRGGLALNDSRYRSFVTPTQDLSGQRFQRAPRVQLNAGMRWRVQPGWTLNAEATYQGASPSDYVTDDDPSSPNFRRVRRVLRGDSATLVNASLEHQVGRWRIGAHVKNLLDKTYAVSRSLGTSVTAGSPRTWGLTLRGDL